MNDRQRRFVEEYLIDQNAAAAYRRAGYTAADDHVASANAARLMANDSIAAAIRAKMQGRSNRTQVTQDYVLTNLTEVVERCMQRAPVMVRRGREFVQATDEEGRGVWRFDAKGSVAALNLLGKHLGLFPDRHEHSGPNGGEIPLVLRIVAQDDAHPEPFDAVGAPRANGALPRGPAPGLAPP